MYSTLSLSKNSKTGKITGTHQKLDRAARSFLGQFLAENTIFPTVKEIVYFEGMRGPDGLKRKSPGVDEPWHFVIPENDDGQLIKTILDHQYNLRRAFKTKNQVRMAFEAAWLAHAVTDGLTPAHHFPLSEATDELMTEKDFVKIFGQPIKGIMRGENALQAARNNWLYWGAGGYMSKHVAFEYGVAITTTSLPRRKLNPKLTAKDLKNINLKKEFYNSLAKINDLDMYSRFRQDGWTTELALEVTDILLPEIVKIIMLSWASAVPELITGGKNENYRR